MNEAPLLIGGSVLLAMLAYSLNPGRGVDTLIQELPIGPIMLTLEQRRNKGIIINEFLRAGLPAGLAFAGVVNAYAESRLKADAVSGYPGEDSVGLFQLNSAAGAAGAGMSTAARMDPVKNTERIIEVCRDALDVREEDDRGVLLPSIRGAFNGGGTVATLANLFCVYVERPASRYQRGREREALSARLFPEYADGRPAAALGGAL